MNKIKELREELKITRAEMSRIFEIPYRTLEDWENEKSKPVKWAEKLLIEKLESMLKSN